MNLNKDVMFNIWSFLHYNDRVKWNESMPPDLKFVKKIKTQDSHNLAIKLNFITKIIVSENTVINKLKSYIKAFTYLLESNDTCLLSMTNQNYRNNIIQQCRTFTESHFRHLKIDLVYPEQISNLVDISKKLLDKINNTEFIKEIKPAFYSVH